MPFAYADLIDPAEQLERESQQQQVRAELSKIPEKVKVAEEKGMRFESFDGCIAIKQVNILGSRILHNLIKPKEQEYLLPYLNHCVEADKLNELVLKFNTILFAKGYITARVEIGNYNKKTKNLTINIQEGVVEHIETTTFNCYTAFPGLVGKELKAQDLEQGLDQLNRLPSQTSVITLWPGKEVGGTVTLP